MRGGIYQSRREYSKAIADYTEAVRIKPNDDYAYRRRGSAYLAAHEYDKAIADYTEAIRINPNEAEFYRQRAQAYLGKHDTKKAAADNAAADKLEAKKPGKTKKAANADRAPDPETVPEAAPV